MTRNNIRRNALIIQNPGDGAYFRPGVLTDVRRFSSYLESNIGGAWDSSEITIAPVDCTIDWIADYFRQRVPVTDYFIVLFTGHGNYSEKHGAMCYLLNDQCFNHAWLKAQTFQVPTLFLTDSCQCIEEFEEGGILEQKSFSAIEDSSRRHMYRQEYDAQLKKQPKGMFVVGSSVSPGEEADEDTKLGGYYVHSLIAVSSRINMNASFSAGIYGIAFIHTLAEKTVEELSEGTQTPYLKGYTRSHQPPFMVKL